MDSSDPLPFGAIARIWFALLWRTGVWMLPVLIGVVLSGALVGIGNGLLGGEPAAALVLTKYVSLVVFAGGSVWATFQAFRAVLGLSFGGYRLTLLPDDRTDGVA